MPSTDFFGAADFFSGGGGSPSPTNSPLSWWIRVPIALVTVSSTTSMPIGARVVQARVQITTPYTAATTISLGVAGTPTIFQLTTDNNTQLAETYIKFQDTSIGAASAPLLITVAGGPAVGAGVALIEYTTPAS